MLTSLPSFAPSLSPSTEPSETSAGVSTPAPSASPSVAPSVAPSSFPRLSPSELPSPVSSVSPSGLLISTTEPTLTSPTSASPSDTPSESPLNAATEVPSVALASFLPSANSSVAPPSFVPSALLTTDPSALPVESPTASPLTSSESPSRNPTLKPSVLPTGGPTTLNPSWNPSLLPSLLPSLKPSVLSKTVAPSVVVTVAPTCCKKIDVHVTSTSLSAGSSVLNFASLTLSAAPASRLTVNLAAFLVSGDVTVEGAFVPSTFTVDPSTSSNAVVLTSSLSSLPVGEYYLVATLAGSTSSEFQVTYEGLSASKLSFSVLSATSPLPAPVLRSAVFANDGSYIVISFNSKTDQGGANRVFTCSELFNFTCAEISSCRWSADSSSVSAFLATQNRCAVPGGTITLKPSAVIKAKCTVTDG
eukprot:gene37713-46531_t